MPKDFPNPTRHKKKRGSLTLSLAHILRFSHYLVQSNEQQTETHADEFI